mgnify:FL=1
MEIEAIAHFRSPFSSKFGIPKQSGLVESLKGEIVFVPKYRNRDSLRGLDEFDYIWLIWGFSANPHKATAPVVRPPVLGGNEKVGVFASRSPFRPNALGLSSVRVESVDMETADGPVVRVLGADLMDGTPIYDIKPYVAYADCHDNVRCGFVDRSVNRRLNVEMPADVAQLFDDNSLMSLRKVLELDPRPRYQHDSGKTYGMPFAGYDIHFRVDGDTLIVVDVVRM